ncbi:unnamed protein product [Dovyalis caffra]|uniref:Titin-like n=1 Tax=Dovyalis caffra TaxID=77055 RepID=A0AAV1R556_9ROSI|nr:unnamed protein product [Dovyalis caffra]
MYLSPDNYGESESLDQESAKTPDSFLLIIYLHEMATGGDRNDISQPISLMSVGFLARGWKFLESPSIATVPGEETCREQIDQVPMELAEKERPQNEKQMQKDEGFNIKEGEAANEKAVVDETKQIAEKDKQVNDVTGTILQIEEPCLNIGEEEKIFKQVEAIEDGEAEVEGKPKSIEKEIGSPEKNEEEERKIEESIELETRKDVSSFDPSLGQGKEAQSQTPNVTSKNLDNRETVKEVCLENESKDSSTDDKTRIIDEQQRGEERFEGVEEKSESCSSFLDEKGRDVVEPIAKIENEKEGTACSTIGGETSMVEAGIDIRNDKEAISEIGEGVQDKRNTDDIATVAHKTQEKQIEEMNSQQVTKPDICTVSETESEEIIKKSLAEEGQTVILEKTAESGSNGGENIKDEMNPEQKLDGLFVKHEKSKQSIDEELAMAEESTEESRDIESHNVVAADNNTSDAVHITISTAQEHSAIADEDKIKDAVTATDPEPEHRKEEKSNYEDKMEEKFPQQDEAGNEKIENSLKLTSGETDTATSSEGSEEIASAKEDTKEEKLIDANAIVDKGLPIEKGLPPMDLNERIEDAELELQNKNSIELHISHRLEQETVLVKGEEQQKISDFVPQEENGLSKDMVKHVEDASEASESIKNTNLGHPSAEGALTTEASSKASETDVVKVEKVHELESKEKLEIDDAGTNLEEEMQKKEETDDEQKQTCQMVTTSEFFKTSNLLTLKLKQNSLNITIIHINEEDKHVSLSGNDRPQTIIAGGTIEEVTSDKVCSREVVDDKVEHSVQAAGLQEAETPLRNEVEQNDGTSNIINEEVIDEPKITDTGEVIDEEKIKDDTTNLSSEVIDEKVVESFQDNEMEAEVSKEEYVKEQTKEDLNTEDILQESIQEASVNNCQNDGKIAEKSSREMHEVSEAAKEVETNNNDESPGSTLQTSLLEEQESLQTENLTVAAEEKDEDGSSIRKDEDGESNSGLKEVKECSEQETLKGEADVEQMFPKNELQENLEHSASMISAERDEGALNKMTQNTEEEIVEGVEDITKEAEMGKEEGEEHATDESNPKSISLESIKEVPVSNPLTDEKKAEEFKGEVSVNSVSINFIPYSYLLTEKFQFLKQIFDAVPITISTAQEHSAIADEDKIMDAVTTTAPEPEHSKEEKSNYEDETEEKFPQQDEAGNEKIENSLKLTSGEIGTAASSECSEEIASAKEDTKEEKPIDADAIIDNGLPIEKGLPPMDLNERIEDAELELQNKTSSELHIIHSLEQETVLVKGEKQQKVSDFVPQEENGLSKDLVQHVEDASEASESIKNTNLRHPSAEGAITTEVSSKASEMVVEKVEKVHESESEEKLEIDDAGTNLEEEMQKKEEKHDEQKQTCQMATTSEFFKTSNLLTLKLKQNSLNITIIHINEEDKHVSLSGNDGHQIIIAGGMIEEVTSDKVCSRESVDDKVEHSVQAAGLQEAETPLRNEVEQNDGTSNIINEEVNDEPKITDTGEVIDEEKIKADATNLSSEVIDEKVVESCQDNEMEAEISKEEYVEEQTKEDLNTEDILPESLQEASVNNFQNDGKIAEKSSREMHEVSEAAKEVETNNNDESPDSTLQTSLLEEQESLKTENLTVAAGEKDENGESNSGLKEVKECSEQETLKGEEDVEQMFPKNELQENLEASMTSAETDEGALNKMTQNTEEEIVEGVEDVKKEAEMGKEEEHATDETNPKSISLESIKEVPVSNPLNDEKKAEEFKGETFDAVPITISTAQEHSAIADEDKIMDAVTTTAPEPEHSKEEKSNYEDETEEKFPQQDEAGNEKIENSLKLTSREIDTAASSECSEEIASAKEDTKEEKPTDADAIVDNGLPIEKGLPPMDLNERIEDAELELQNKTSSELHVIHSLEQETVLVQGEKQPKVSDFVPQEENGLSKDLVKHVEDASEASESIKNTNLGHPSAEGAITTEASSKASEMDVEKVEKVHELESEEKLETDDAGTNLEEEMKKKEETHDEQKQTGQMATTSEFFKTSNLLNLKLKQNSLNITIIHINEEDKLVSLSGNDGPQTIIAGDVTEEVTSDEVCRRESVDDKVEHSVQAAGLQEAEKPLRNEVEQNDGTSNIINEEVNDEPKITDTGEVIDKEKIKDDATNLSSEVIDEKVVEICQDNEMKAEISKEEYVEEQTKEDLNTKDILPESIQEASVNNFQNDGKIAEKSSREMHEVSEAAKEVETNNNDESPVSTLQTSLLEEQESLQTENLNVAAEEKDEDRSSIIKDEDGESNSGLKEAKECSEQETLKGEEDVEQMFPKNEQQENLEHSASMISAETEEGALNKMAQNTEEEIVEGVEDVTKEAEMGKEEGEGHATNETNPKSISLESIKEVPVSKQLNDEKNAEEFKGEIFKESVTSGTNESIAHVTYQNDGTPDTALQSSTAKEVEIVQGQGKDKSLAEASPEEEGEHDRARGSTRVEDNSREVRLEEDLEKNDDETPKTIDAVSHAKNQHTEFPNSTLEISPVEEQASLQRDNLIPAETSPEKKKYEDGSSTEKDEDNEKNTGLAEVTQNAGETLKAEANLEQILQNNELIENPEHSITMACIEIEKDAFTKMVDNHEEEIVEIPRGNAEAELHKEEHTEGHAIEKSKINSLSKESAEEGLITNSQDAAENSEKSIKEMLIVGADETNQNGEDCNSSLTISLVKVDESFKGEDKNVSPAEASSHDEKEEHESLDGAGEGNDSNPDLIVINQNSKRETSIVEEDFEEQLQKMEPREPEELSTVMAAETETGTLSNKIDDITSQEEVVTILNIEETVAREKKDGSEDIDVTKVKKVVMEEDLKLVAEASNANKSVKNDVEEENMISSGKEIETHEKTFGFESIQKLEVEEERNIDEEIENEGIKEIYGDTKLPGLSEKTDQHVTTEEHTSTDISPQITGETTAEEKAKTEKEMWEESVITSVDEDTKKKAPEEESAINDQSRIIYEGDKTQMLVEQELHEIIQTAEEDGDIGKQGSVIKDNLEVPPSGTNEENPLHKETKDETNTVKQNDEVDSNSEFTEPIEARGSVDRLEFEILRDKQGANSDMYLAKTSEEGILQKESNKSLIEISSLESRSKEEILEEVKPAVNDPSSTPITGITREMSFKEEEPEDKRQIKSFKPAHQEKGPVTNGTERTALENVDIDAKPEDASNFIETEDNGIPAGSGAEELENEMLKETAIMGSKDNKEETTNETSLRNVLDDKRECSTMLSKASELVTNEGSKTTDETSTTYENIKIPQTPQETEIMPKEDVPINARDASKSADPKIQSIIEEVGSYQFDNLNKDRVLDNEKQEGREISKLEEVRGLANQEEIYKSMSLKDEDLSNVGDEALKHIEAISAERKEAILEEENSTKKSEDSLTENVEANKAAFELEAGTNNHEQAISTKDFEVLVEENFEVAESGKKLEGVSETETRDHSHEMIPETDPGKVENMIEIQNESTSESMEQSSQESQKVQEEIEEKTELKFEAEGDVKGTQNTDETVKDVILTEEVHKEAKKADGETLKCTEKDVNDTRELYVKSTEDERVHEVEESSLGSREFHKATNSNEQTAIVSSDIQEAPTMEEMTVAEAIEDEDNEMPAVLSTCTPTEESEEIIKTMEEEDKCCDDIKTTTMVEITKDSLEEDQLDEKTVQVSNITSNDSISHTIEAEACQQEKTKDNTALELHSSNLESQVPADDHENITREHVAEENEDADDVQENKRASDAVYESKDHGINELNTSKIKEEIEKSSETVESLGAEATANEVATEEILPKVISKEEQGTSASTERMEGKMKDVEVLRDHPRITEEVPLQKEDCKELDLSQLELQSNEDIPNQSPNEVLEEDCAEATKNEVATDETLPEVISKEEQGTSATTERMEENIKDVEVLECHPIATEEVPLQKEDCRERDMSQLELQLESQLEEESGTPDETKKEIKGAPELGSIVDSQPFEALKEDEGTSVQTEKDCGTETTIENIEEYGQEVKILADPQNSSSPKTTEDTCLHKEETNELEVSGLGVDLDTGIQKDSLDEVQVEESKSPDAASKLQTPEYETSKEASEFVSEDFAESEETEIKEKHPEVAVTDMVAEENQSERTIDATEIIHEELTNEERKNQQIMEEKEDADNSDPVATHGEKPTKESQEEYELKAEESLRDKGTAKNIQNEELYKEVEKADGNERIEKQMDTERIIEHLHLAAAENETIKETFLDKAEVKNVKEEGSELHLENQSIETTSGNDGRTEATTVKEEKMDVEISQKEGPMDLVEANETTQDIHEGEESSKTTTEPIEEHLKEAEIEVDEHPQDSSSPKATENICSQKEENKELEVCGLGVECNTNMQKNGSNEFDKEEGRTSDKDSILQPQGYESKIKEKEYPPESEKMTEITETAAFEKTSDLRTKTSEEAFKTVSAVYEHEVLAESEVEHTESKEEKHPEVAVTDLVARENQNEKTIDATEIMHDELTNEKDKQQATEEKEDAKNCNPINLGEETTKESHQIYDLKGEESQEDKMAKEIQNEEVSNERTSEYLHQTAVENETIKESFPDEAFVENAEDLGTKLQVENQHEEKISAYDRTETTTITNKEFGREISEKESLQALAEVDETTQDIHQGERLSDSPSDKPISTEAEPQETTERKEDAPQWLLREPIVEASQSAEVGESQPGNAIGNVDSQGPKHGTERSIDETKSANISLFDMMQKSTRERQVVRDLTEEKEANASKEETRFEGVKIKSDEEEKEEHKQTDTSSDAPVMVEASRDIVDVKVAHKKSHSILSGVGSKVKNSISKVKKAIRGKSSHPKQHSPR